MKKIKSKIKEKIGYLGFLGLLGLLGIPLENYGFFGFFGFFACDRFVIGLTYHTPQKFDF